MKVLKINIEKYPFNNFKVLKGSKRPGQAHSSSLGPILKLEFGNPM